MRYIRTKIEDIEPGRFYYATHYPQGYEHGVDYMAGDDIKFDLVIYVTGEKPFLRFTAWQFKYGKVTNDFAITDLWVGPKLVGV